MSGFDLHSVRIRYTNLAGLNSVNTVVTASSSSIEIDRDLGSGLNAHQILDINGDEFETRITGNVSVGGTDGVNPFNGWIISDESSSLPAIVNAAIVPGLVWFGNPSVSWTADDVRLNMNGVSLNGTNPSNGVRVDVDFTDLVVAAEDGDAFALSPTGTLSAESVFADHGFGADTHSEGDGLRVADVGSAALVGTVVQGSNGGQFTIATDGSLSFDPNGAFYFSRTGTR